VPDVPIPTFRELLYPTLQALDELGGSGTKEEIDQRVIEDLKLSEDQLAVEFPSDATARGSKVIYRIAWARTSLKLFVAADNSKQGVWSITPHGRALLASGDEAVRAADSAMRKALREKRKAGEHAEPEATDSEDEGDSDATTPSTADQSWTTTVLDILFQMPSAAFERLAARLLREVGFTRVEVLGGSGDEGLDGTGLLEVQLLSFPVFFQCKRYQGQVGPRHLRDFRGAMSGRGDKGLFITTGTFTPAARDEAQRPGTPPIDLIDGDRLCRLLKDHRLGLTTELVEQVTVDPTFFSGI